MNKQESGWLTLSEASALLGIHPTTLRQWSDEGHVTAHRTPGGHRRFSRDEIELLLLAQKRQAQPGTLVREALEYTRNEIASEAPSQPWSAVMAHSDVEVHRELGRRMLTLLVQLGTRRRSLQDLYEEACALGAQYGHDLQRSGCSLIDATMAFLFFRDSTLESIFQLPEFRGIPATQRHTMLSTMTQFLNQVLRAMMEAHQRSH